MTLAFRCEGTENLLRSTQPCTERRMNRPPVRSRIGMFACEEQRAGLRFSHCRRSIQRARRYIAVGSAGKRIELPVMLMRCQQRIANLLCRQTEHLRQFGAGLRTELIGIAANKLRRTRAPRPP